MTLCGEEGCPFGARVSVSLSMGGFPPPAEGDVFALPVCEVHLPDLLMYLLESLDPTDSLLVRGVDE